MLGAVGIAYRVFVLNETVSRVAAKLSVQRRRVANVTVPSQPESVALPGGSFAVLLLASGVGHKALAARGTPSPAVLMVFLILELGYVVASTFTLVSITLESPEQQKALTEDLPKVRSPVLRFIDACRAPFASPPGLTMCCVLRSRASCSPPPGFSCQWLRWHRHTSCGLRVCRTRI